MRVRVGDGTGQGIDILVKSKVWGEPLQKKLLLWRDIKSKPSVKQGRYIRRR